MWDVHASAKENDDIDEDTEDELKVQNITMTLCAVFLEGTYAATFRCLSSARIFLPISARVNCHVTDANKGYLVLLLKYYSKCQVTNAYRVCLGLVIKYDLKYMILGNF